MKLNVLGIALLAVALLPSITQAAECHKQYDSRECLVQHRTLETKLTEMYAQEEKATLVELKDYDADFQNEALTSLRETNSAFTRFKDAECYSNPLRQGMSLKDSAVLSDSCKVQWRKKRIRELAKRLTTHAK